MARRVWISGAVLVAVACGAFWLLVFVPERRQIEFCTATRAEFNTLAKKRPTNITRKQWHHIVAWTLNAHANCISATRRIDPEERDQFLAELRRRLQGPVELADIDWIWDEIVRLTPGGRSYSDRWRPTTPERLCEFEAGEFSWGGIEVD